jgi:hypothetical protein
VDHSLLESLLAGDILFIDSSHVTRPGGDVVVEILNVLPRLARGVITHFHDIFTPKDYPWDWLFKEPRMWNEQYMLALNPCFEVMLSLQHLWHAAPADLEAACVPLDGQPLVAPSTSEGVQ